MAGKATGLRTVGVVLAGGVGTRVGLAIPKQLLKIAGKPVIEHTLAAFEAAPEVDEVVVLMTPGYLEDINAIVEHRGFRKVTAVIEGGTTRNDSTRNALDHLGTDPWADFFKVKQTLPGAPAKRKPAPRSRKRS